MTAKWGSCVILTGCLALLVGCRSSQPDLKPAKVAQTLREPPQENRYETTGYPKRAFDEPSDPAKMAIDSKNIAGAPGRNMMTGGMGGLPGR